MWSRLHKWYKAHNLSAHLLWCVVGALCFINGVWVTEVTWQQGLYPFIGGCFIALGIGLTLNKRL